MKKIEQGVYEVPFVVSDSLKNQIEIIRTMFINAQKNIVRFAKQHQWEEYIEKPFILRGEIYDTQIKFINSITNFLNLPPNINLPRSFSAALENEIFMAVSPSVYQEIYPVEQNNLDAYVRLITHEIAHRLHVRILNGDEKQMGPEWFYEGFALYVANQFTDFNCEKSDRLDIIDNKKKDVLYPYYAAVFRKLTQYKPIETLIYLPKEKDFIEQVKIMIG